LGYQAQSKSNVSRWAGLSRVSLKVKADPAVNIVCRRAFESVASLVAAEQSAGRVAVQPSVGHAVDFDL